MGESSNNLFFYTRQQEDNFDPRKFRNLAEGLAALNFYVAWPGEVTDQSALTSAGMSPMVQTKMQEAKGTPSFGWLLQVYSLDHGSPSDRFTFQMGNDTIDEEDAMYGALDLEFLYRVFDYSSNGVAMYDHFLEAARLIYEVYHPMYGYQYDPRDSRSPVTREEALALQISHLYDINFFGPELVEKLGRERVESAPAQKVIPLDDGGIMLIPSIYFSPEILKYDARKVAAHLGLSYPV